MGNWMLLLAFLAVFVAGVNVGFYLGSDESDD